MAGKLFDILNSEPGMISGALFCDRHIIVLFPTNQGVDLQIQDEYVQGFNSRNFFNISALRLTSDEVLSQLDTVRETKYFDKLYEAFKASTEPAAVPFKKVLSIPVTPEEEKAAHFFKLETMIYNEQYDRLKNALAQDPVDINYIQPSSRTLLQCAVSCDDKTACGILLAHGADPNVISPFGSGLHSAVYCRKKEIAEFLLEHGASVDMLDKVNETPLQVAVVLEKEDIVRLLLEKGANPYKAAVDLFDLARKNAESPDAKPESRGIARMLDDWKEKKAHATHVKNLARLDRILGRKKA